MDSFLKWELQIDSYQLIPLVPEGSPVAERAFYRVQTSKQSWILINWQSALAKKNIVLSKVIDEYTSKQNIFCEAGVPIANIKAIDKKQGLLLLEDLGDLKLDIFYQQNKKSAIRYYQQAIDYIVSLQDYRVNWSRYSAKDFFREMLWTKEHLVDQLLHFEWENSFLNKCFKEWEELCNSLEQYSYRPTHRDYHSRNLMIKNKQLYLIDFQDAGLFPRCYDLASLLYDPYVGLDDSFRDQIVKYLVAKRACSEKIIKKELLLTAMQRVFKAAGSFASFYSLRKQKSHLPFILPALKTLKQILNQAKSYPCFLDLVNHLLQMHRSYSL